MPYGYRRRYRYRRYRPRRYVRRWFRRRMRRFVNGSSKSTVRVKVPVTSTFTAQGVTSNGNVWPGRFHPYATNSATNLSALGSPLYRQYCSLYDEVKCIGAKFVISIGTPIGTSVVPNLQVITAWDRRSATNDGVPTYSELLNYGTVRSATAVNNSIAKLVRSCYASDLMERAQWKDADLTLDAAQLYSDNAWNQAGDNPNFFCPQMIIGFLQGNASAAQAISFSVEGTYYFAFRNPKYGASSSSAKSVSSNVMDRDAAAGMEREDLADDAPIDDELLDDIMDLGESMQRGAAEGAAARRAILASRKAAKNRVSVTKTI